VEQRRVREIRASQLLLEFPKGRRAGDRIAADHGDPTTTILVPVRVEPLVLLGPINIALL
jgi:hypothetical protein